MPYRLWIRLRTPTRPNAAGTLVYLQFSDAVDRNGKEVYSLNSGNFIAIRSGGKEGWSWVGRDLSSAQSTEPVLQFRTAGEIKVRVTAGSGGAWDQLVLSPSKYLERPPSENIIPKSGK